MFKSSEKVIELTEVLRSSGGAPIPVVLSDEQAAVHTAWFPHPPECLDTQNPELYGFRKLHGIWSCVEAPEQEWALVE